MKLYIIYSNDFERTDAFGWDCLITARTFTQNEILLIKGSYKFLVFELNIIIIEYIILEPQIFQHTIIVNY